MIHVLGFLALNLCQWPDNSVSSLQHITQKEREKQSGFSPRTFIQHACTHVRKGGEEVAKGKHKDVILREVEDVLEVVPQTPHQQQRQDEQGGRHADHVEEV